MREEIPKRLVYNPETGKEYYKSYNWVLQEGKSPKEILLEIKRELDNCHFKFQDVDDLLHEAEMLIFQRFNDSRNNHLYIDISNARKDLSKYQRKTSQKKKDELITDVIKEVKTSIAHYYALHNE